ncbi:tetratricopeptide repeat protein [Actinomadura sp. ATCC 31491]|uniref:Tetratricopeptide repeat protein n=1 Tax=Actinomadura luzonensis TaxID=2805427 RepID=A0ABT0G039_9ACTN|nr:tetratricopeptide repeat protein [Actinomadura luzonensis]MCK2217974.1 tetratricopeptide repeat protein [Actinomadura luzonensis]
MTEGRSHLRVEGEPPARWGAARLLMPMIDAHRRPRGPYTVAAALLRRLVPPALERSAELVAAHDIEIRAAAPELAGLVPARRVTAEAGLSDDERILVPAPRRTLRLANGLTEFVREAVPAGLALAVCNLAEADPTDLELLDVMARRVPPATLTLLLCTGGPAAAPDTRDADELWAAVDRSMREGFLHAAAELGERGMARTEPGGAAWWRFAQRTATALGGLGRTAEALAVWERVREASQDPKMHAAAAYGTAMLDARHPDPGQRDLGRARRWINLAIAISTILPDPAERAFKLGFDRNGLALIELRHGRPAAALALVESALELARELGARHPLHRMVLLANRAQLLAALGRHKEALDDYAAAIALDPAFPDYYLERGNLLFKLGQRDEAQADYERAMRAGPPLPEAHYNRAELRVTRGDTAGALADLARVVELDPGYLDAYINRAGLLAACGRDEEAAADVEAGLALAPGNPHLLTVLGQLETAAGRFAAARAALDRAVTAAPDLAAAWGNRGVLRYANGDLDGAVADLTRALDLQPQPDLYANRAVALRALGRVTEAEADERRASAFS